jgi:hypothetical protein
LNFFDESATFVFFLPLVVTVYAETYSIILCVFEGGSLQSSEPVIEVGLKYGSSEVEVEMKWSRSRAEVGLK